MKALSHDESFPSWWECSLAECRVPIYSPVIWQSMKMICLHSYLWEILSVHYQNTKWRNGFWKIVFIALVQFQRVDKAMTTLIGAVLPAQTLPRSFILSFFPPWIYHLLLPACILCLSFTSFVFILLYILYCHWAWSFCIPSTLLIYSPLFCGALAIVNHHAPISNLFPHLFHFSVITTAVGIKKQLFT